MNDRQKDLMTFYGTTVSGTISGIVALNSDYLYTTTPGIQHPKGTNLKIWGIRVTGPAATVQIVFTKTSGATPAIHNALQHTWLSGLSTPATILSLDRPIVIPSLAGTELVQAAWTQTSSPGPTNVEFDVEVADGMI